MVCFRFDYPRIINVACRFHHACNMKEHAMAFCIAYARTGASRETGVSAWHERTLCLVFKWWALKNGRRPRVARFEIMCQEVTRRDRHPPLR